MKRAILAVAILTVLVHAQPKPDRYSAKKLQNLLDVSRTNNAAFLLYDDLGVLLLVKAGGLIDILKNFREYKNPAYRVYPALSLDGTKVAFASGMTSLTGKGGREEIWVFNSADNSFRKIHEKSAVIPEFVVDLPYLMALSWSPDGSNLAINAGRGQLEIWPVENGDRRLVATNIAQDTIPSWSPDGSKIAYESVTMLGDKRIPHINVLEVSTGRFNKICEGGDPSWSKRGDQIAVLEEHEWTYFTVLPDGSSRKRAVKAGFLVSGPLLWSADSKYALYNSYYDGGVEAILVDLQTGKKKVLATGQRLVVVGWH